MPIIIKDYGWKQTNEKVIVRVPMKGIISSKADVFTFDNYLKVHFPPLLFEICLRDLIDEERSQCRIVKDEVIFELVKQEVGPWDVLEAPLTKSEVMAVKQRAIELTQKRNDSKKKEREEQKSKIDKLAVKAQITLDTQERNKIDALRDHERNVAMDELEHWRQQQLDRHSNTARNSKEIFSSSPSSSSDDSDNEQNIKDKYDYEIVKHKEKRNIEEYVDVAEKENSTESCVDEKEAIKTPSPINPTLKSTDKMIFDDPGTNNDSFQPNNNSITEKQVISSPRRSGKIGVTFTPRAFPTPSRESKLEEENEWLEKQAEARRRTGFNIEDLRPEECDPVWLKDKGDTFYKVGNYLGAISAYSHAIKLNPKLPALYSNRAAAHLAIGNLRRVVQDTSQALDLLTPCIEMNASSRSLCHARRGSALCQLNMHKAGLVDLEAALALCPDNETLENDIRTVKSYLENPSVEEEGENSTEIDIN